MKIRSFMCAFVGLLVTTSAILPLHADDNTNTITKDESVYTILNADGSVKEITVSDILHSQNGFQDYQDTSSLTDVQNLKSDDPVKQSNSGYTWNSDATDIYYQGKSKQDLPFDIAITYYLNDVKTDPKDMVGKSGHVKMQLHITNNQKQTFTVDDKSYDLVTPFVFGSIAMFDEDAFTNVKVNAGNVSSDSSHSIATSVVMPGLKDGLSQIIDGETMSTLQSYLIDDLTIEADTTKFTSPTWMLGAATTTDALKDDFKEIDTTALSTQLDQLQQATDTLVAGASTLSEGANTLSEGAKQLNDGTNTLVDGISSLHQGSQDLQAGASQAVQGISSLKGGLGTLVNNNETLVSGINTIADSILQTANQTLESNAAIKADPNYTPLTWSNYADQLAYYAGITDTMRQAAYAQIKQQVTEAGVTLDDAQLNMVIYMAAVNQATDLKAFLTQNQANLTIAQNVQQATQAAQSLDYANLDRILTLATYEGALGNIQTLAKQNNITLTTRQCEELLKLAVAQGVTDITTVDPQTLVALVQTVQQNYPDASALGVDDASIQPIVAALRQQQTDPVIYQALVKTLQAADSSLTEANIALLATEGSMYHKDATSLQDMIAKVKYDISVASAISNYLTASQSEEGKQAINGYLNALVTTTEGESIAQIKQLSTNLQSIAAYKQGIQDYTNGVLEAYNGSIALEKGLQQLQSGTESLTQGSSQLQSGANTLKQGVQSLTDGSSQLAQGADTLYQGLQQYNDEAISQLTKNSKINSLEQVSKLMNAIEQQGQTYNNFSGISENTEGNVKFIFKVSSAKQDKVQTSTTEKTEQKSFWDRVKDLFDFSTLF